MAETRALAWSRSLFDRDPVTTHSTVVAIAREKRAQESTQEMAPIYIVSTTNVIAEINLISLHFLDYTIKGTKAESKEL